MSRVLGVCGASSVLGIYNLLFFNRYFPLTEGWFSAYGSLILQGKVPYRDFYVFLTPLYPLQVAAFMAVFGSHFIALRILGVGVIVVMTATLFLIYARWFPPFAAAFATVVSMVYYQSGVAHVAYDYTQLLNAYALVAIYLIVRHVESPPRADGRFGPWDTTGLATAGAMSACVFLTKQSNGFFIASCALLAALLGSARWGLRHAARSSIPFMVGGAVPVAVLAAWLFRHDALAACLQQIYFDAVQAKGSWDSILLGWSRDVLNKSYFISLREVVWYVMLVVSVNGVFRAVGKRRWRGIVDTTWYNAVMVGAVVLVGLGAIWLPLAHPAGVRGWIPQTIIYWPGMAVAVATAVPALIVLVGGVSLAMRRPLVGPGVLAFAIVIVGFIVGNGTSAGIGEISCFLGLGLLAGWLMSLRADPIIGKVALLAASFCFTAYLAGLKYDSPYAWWSVEQPTVRGELQTATLPLLDGLRLSPDTLRTFQVTTEIVKRYTQPGDAIVAFPHMPAFYLLTDRWPGGKAIVSWFDILSDGQAKEQAAGLLSQPPAVIIYLEMPESVWTAHERLFRHGNSLGQRDIQAAILTLTAPAGAYVLEASLPVLRDCVLKVWRRKAPVEQRGSPGQSS